MTPPQAARFGDPFKHSAWLAAVFVGVAVAAVIVATGGAAAVVIAAGLAAGGGVLLADYLLTEEPGITTGSIDQGSPYILIERQMAASIFDTSLCYWPFAYNHGAKPIVEGSKTVFYHCKPAARRGDELLCGAKIAKGAPTVLIGGPAVRVKGTRRSWIDDVLDTASVALTAAGLTSLIGAGLILVTEAVSLSMHLQNKTTLQNAVVSKVIPLAELPIIRLQNNAIDASNIRATSAADAINAARLQAVEDAAYAQYRARQVKAGNPIKPQTYWRTRHFVRTMLMRRAPTPVTPKLKPHKSFNWKMFGAGVLVDIFRNGREIGREDEVAEVLKQFEHGFDCDDTSYLEPA